MKLNADIVYAALKSQFTVKMTGQKTTEMTISRPELYLDNETEFLSNHLYLATADHLPLHPRLKKNVVIVVIGESARLAHYRDNCCLITIRDKADFFMVNRIICNLFDRYYEWEKKLFDIFLDSADLQEIVDCSTELFGCGIHVLDATFHYLTTPDEQVPEANLDTAQISRFLAKFEMETMRKDAFVLNFGNDQYLCSNLFNAQDEYIGCVYFNGSNRIFTDGDRTLAEFLARLIAKAIEKNPSILNSEQATIKSALINLVNEYPLTPSQKWIINLAASGRRYVCICQHSSNQLTRLPAGYVSAAFEQEFPGSYAFLKGNSIVCYLDTDPYNDKQGDYHAELNVRLKKFLAETNGIAGISNSFSNLYNARISFLQAEAAIGNGMITNPDTGLYYFQTYALISMVVNSMGSLPAEAYFSENLQNLIQHDKSGPISYLETLRTFLRNNLSYSQTAEELFIHRSTVVDRISRIERELDVDLKDSDTRLQLEIILKAMEIEDMVRQGES